MRALGILLVILTCLLSGCNNVTTVAYNLHEREANEIVVLLTTHGIGAQKMAAATSATGGESQTKMWNIVVPAKDITEAIAVLNQAGLPRTKGKSLLDLFGAQGLVPSEMQNKIRYQEGLSEQLANTIRKMDGIIDADVQITFPQDEEANIPLTASVYVKHRGVLDNPNSLMITKIKRLISSAMPGLTIENVSVITDRALFSDVTVESIEMAQELEYVSVWGVIVARQSVTLFRVILYLFILFLFLLICATVWVIWKIYPMINSLGFKSLLNPKPFDATPQPATGEMHHHGEEEMEEMPAAVEESAYEVQEQQEAPPAEEETEEPPPEA